ICDASGDYPGLLWLFTGTPEFFDTKRGVAGLPPLDDRIRFIEQGKFASRRQPQLRLVPFDAPRLKSVAVRLRELYPSQHRARLLRAVDDAFLDQLVEKVTAGFRGDVGVVPRQFLRELVNVMDLLEEHPDYVPREAYDFHPKTLAPEEQAAVAGPSAVP